MTTCLQLEDSKSHKDDSNCHGAILSWCLSSNQCPHFCCKGLMLIFVLVHKKVSDDGRETQRNRTLSKRGPLSLNRRDCHKKGQCLSLPFVFSLVAKMPKVTLKTPKVTSSRLSQYWAFLEVCRGLSIWKTA